MKKIPVYSVDAFTNQAFGGNSAGVVPVAKGLTDGEMQKIAKELNLSETGFLLPTEKSDADFRIRYFTPSSEIDFCGHATLAMAWVIATELDGMRDSNVVKLETNIGIVPVDFVYEEGQLKRAVMTQVASQVLDFEIGTEEAAQLIGVAPNAIDKNYPIKVGFTGNWHLLVPIKTRDAVDAATPNIEKLNEHNKKHKLATTHLFTFDSGEEECMLYTRDFAPAVGITEDPVTGSANGALAGYLITENILDVKDSTQFKVAQGHSVGRPGYLDVSVEPVGNTYCIKVGGQAVPTLSGEIRF